MHWTRTVVAASVIVVMATSLRTQAQTRVGVGVNVDTGRGTRIAAGVEVLTRGPVHEAFASPVDFEPERTIAVSRRPPPPVEEYAPEQAPPDAEWIPGYWWWDEDRDDFLWVSGVWRVPPPGVNWVPGYWNNSSGGYEYTPGAWLDDDDGDEIEYLPEPPRTLEEGPIGPSPSDRHIWVSGTWYWENSWRWDGDPRFRADRRRVAGYVWRPGYWTVAQPDWVWVPAHYVSTPRGCIFVAGYWDYPLERRGVLFAPVAFERNIYTKSNYRYTPGITIDVTVLTSHLFSRVNCGQYYFGDYYAPEYATVGYRPFCAPTRQLYCYDPIFVQLSHRHGRDDGWATRLRREYAYRSDNVAARPPRTYAAQRVQLAAEPGAREATGRRGDDIRTAALGRPLAEASTRDGSPGLRRLSDDQRAQAAQRSRSVRAFTEQRRTLENSPREGDAVRRSDREAGAAPGADGRDSRSTTAGAERIRVQRPALQSRSASARSRAPERPNSPEAPEPKKARVQSGGNQPQVARPVDSSGRESQGKRVRREKDKGDDKDDDR